MQDIEKIWKAYHRKLLSFVRVRVACMDDAEEILNYVFAKLIEQSRHRGLPTNISAWLYQAVRNRIIDYYRSSRPRRVLSDDLMSEKPDRDVGTELAACLLPMIECLPIGYQQVLRYSEIEGKKQKEVASELGLTLAAVKSRVRRGREMLRKHLLRCCEIHQNRYGRIVDYDQKISGFCDDEIK